MADTTWTLAGSPYDATSSVIVFPGATLNIEPGVLVRFASGTQLEVRGALVANGTPSATIRFTSAAASGPYDWSGIYVNTNQGGRALLRHVDIAHAASAIYLSCCWGGGPVTLDRSVIHDGGTALGGYAGWAMRVDNSTIHHNQCGASQADKIIWGTTFHNNTYGLCSTERISVYDSRFVDNQVGLHGGRGEIKFSTIERNGVGIRAFYEGFSASYNTIANNGVGVEFGYSPWPLLARNNLLGATSFDVQNAGSYNQYAGENYWGTTNATQVGARIYDALDNPSRGLVNVTPMRSVPIPTHPNRFPVTKVAPVAPVECSALRGTVLLDASASSDPDNDTLYFAWSDPMVGTVFADPNAAVTTASVPLGSRTLTLRVTDGDLVSIASVYVAVRDTLPPTVAIVRPAQDTLYAFDEPVATLPAGTGAAALGPLTIVAQPADACGVAWTRLAGGEATNASLSSAPYAISVNPNATAAQPATWTATAFDHAGLTAQANASFLHVGTRTIQDGCAAALSEGACATFASPSSATDFADATCRTIFAADVCDALG